MQIGFFEKPFHDPLIPVLRSIYETAGLCFNAVIAPPKRLLLMQQSGGIDGEVGRSNFFFINEEPSLIKIETPILKIYGVYITKNTKEKIDWGIPYLNEKRVGSLRGRYWSDYYAKEKVINLHLAHDINQLFTMLEYNRIDGFLTDTFSLKIATLANKINPDKYWISPNLVDLSIYHSLSNKHLEIASSLEKVIKSNIKSGLINHLIEQEIIKKIEPIIKYDITSSDSWYPFVFNDSSGKAAGIFVDLIPEILTRARLKGLPVKLSSTISAQKSLDLGELDLDIESEAWHPNLKFDEKYFTSKTILSADDVIIFHKKNTQHNLKLDYSKEVGTIKGYDYFDQSQFERVNFESEKELLIAVSNGVVKQGIIAKKSAMYWSKVLN
ncbi:transporter substrate-binding domain-containing protein [Zooshikella ganghwensis]|uniref:transporter substrate-binding domain-containing protein n=1 Tax=Zooshikella ganghwensis TaxID=202772 RepID=UPI00146FC4BA|nr:transporter substrate-binding domain-containing protein [Zooshikella ganghwensis]